MNVQQSYNLWSAQYDTNKNKTRDLEAQVLRSTLADVSFKNCLEIGCGTGKNTEWLITRAAHVTAADLSEGMLDIAREKVVSERVEFRQADILQPWNFGTGRYDLVTFSLVLEHIEHLEPVFREVAQALVPGGYIYVGELHPFKQYTGTKARFDTEEGRQEVPCFNHHISDFLKAAEQNGLELVRLDEHFDENDRTTIPRVVTLLLKKRLEG
jgi:2-polyprenyl-3-methyl-5-hydroxy-6-metoxy-1,4-benzoquinol methylase